jgi:transposase-like protein
MSKKKIKPVVMPPPNPEVDAKPTRRTFTAAYKLKILDDADGCSEGEIGALLRREGLYSSHLTAWRRQRAEGALQALGKKRGRKAKPRDKEKEQLIKENAKLRRKLEQAEKIIEIQKKVSALLAQSESNDDSGESR